MGAATPLKETVIPLRFVVRGIESARVSCEARLEPKMATRLPGATAWPAVKLAAFTMPPALIVGACAKAADDASSIEKTAAVRLLRVLIPQYLTMTRRQL